MYREFEWRRVGWARSRLPLVPCPPESSTEPASERGTGTGGGRPPTWRGDRAFSAAPHSSDADTPEGSPASGTTPPGRHWVREGRGERRVKGDGEC